MPTSQPSLFEPQAPTGLRYRPELIDADYEQRLIRQLARVEFAPFVMRGVEARRRVAFFGASYGRADAPPLPDFLLELREKIGAWTAVAADAFAMALINEYRPGSPIGWHRDAPQYDVVAGVSLLSQCRMRFRPYRRPSAVAGTAAPRRTATYEIVLEPRSAYLMAGESRYAFEHHIPAAQTLRYSITFRTRRS